MQVYFSHSYRDIPVNTYFTGLLDAAGILLRADQKTDVWCVAKLERYLFELAGFVSIVTRRVAPDGSLTFSPYIGRELGLARRARTPRVLFVDDQVLNHFPSMFPPSAIPFFHEAPETEMTRHVDAIGQFRRILSSGGARPPRTYQPNEAAVVVGEGPVLRDAASHVAAILRSQQYNPRVINASKSLDETFDDIDDFESLLRSELCVFVLDRDLSYADLFLAMAHAHCIPSVRLRHDPEAENSGPELSGVVHWNSSGGVAPAFMPLFQNYQSAFANPAGKDDLLKLATPAPIVPSLNLWDPSDGHALVVHVVPDSPYVTDRVDGVIRVLSITTTEASRIQSDAVCRGLYDRVRREAFYYTFEPVLVQTNVQKIRTPAEISALNCGTCIDFACLFASLLECAHERPVIIVVGTTRGAHAITAYVTHDAILGEDPLSLGDVRGAVNRGEIVPFETTGAVEARGRQVGAETETEREEGANMLDYQTAKNAAKRLLLQNDIELKHCVDVQKIRRG
jgi:hypothetical protein